jgi:hypothetical protein
MAVDTNKPIWQFEAEDRKRKKDSFKPKSALDDVQSGLSILGLTPLLGAAPDALNVLMSILRRDPKAAAVNAASFVPGPIGLGAGYTSVGADIKNRTSKKELASSDQILEYLKDV